MGKHLIHPDQETILELPYSEVCMHLRVAGTRMRARLQPTGMVQLLDADGRELSFPITAAEAGLDYDQDGWSSVVADPPAPLADQLPANPPTTGDEHRAVLEAVSEPLAIQDRHPWRGEGALGPGGPLPWDPDLGDLSVPDPDQRP